MNLDAERDAIKQELNVLREQGARRQELSHHACKRLFFDLGIRPSMAAVRDLTQTGSASDIPKDIDSFWERIRAASRVRIGTGIIPKALEERAGELLGALFQEATVHARSMLDGERHDVHTQIAAADQKIREAEIRHTLSNEALERSDARAEAAWERVRKLEADLTTIRSAEAVHQENLHIASRRLEAENQALRERVETEQTANATLRDRIDALHMDMRHATEHYAQQIKDAVAEAERRVKPMLVELDALRGMAATYQSGVRDASRKEFDFIQQLAAAKVRGDRLEAELREQSDELASLTHEISTLRNRQKMDPVVADLLYTLACSGRLTPEELAEVGTAADGHVPLPSRCPKCEDGEPELSQVDHQYELQCPECEHSSGAGTSRLDAVARFLYAHSVPSRV